MKTIIEEINAIIEGTDIKVLSEGGFYPACYELPNGETNLTFLPECCFICCDMFRDEGLKHNIRIVVDKSKTDKMGFKTWYGRCPYCSTPLVISRGKIERG